MFSSSIRMAQDNPFESLPVELIADILAELDLSSLITVSYLSHRLRAVASEPSLNPWRRPILRTLRSPLPTYDPGLKNLSVRSVVPRHNFVEILALARAHYLLFDATLPNLKEGEWEECFRRRFLPSWTKAKKDDMLWKEAFMKVLFRVWHRINTSCTADEAWTKYLVLNRNGTANQLDSVSRNYSPITIFEQLRIQSDLMHLPPSVRVLVEFADVRILAFGVLSKPKTIFGVNPNARQLLHPPGVENFQVVDHPDIEIASQSSESASDISIERLYPSRRVGLNDIYQRLTHPLPVLAFENYPFYTPGGADKRWSRSSALDQGEMQWVGPMLITAQLVGVHTKELFISPPQQDGDLVEGPGRSQFASATFADLVAIAPWLEPTKWIEGAGLGHND
ncbi:uncharacterized protein FIBRA_02695 [Fibroporia radiculosa]|uniref:F-box domain-containing protein n=1 Tax=Fibroporia radiculosa TaxID=599839 RepID=J4HVC2_9APHY|nr:uncharacterized protein FIBRA_02695 [Fibroporia radiculosa]CCM00657.1 predicted protein [Fibroporia radiculosa]